MQKTTKTVLEALLVSGVMLAAGCGDNANTNTDAGCPGPGCPGPADAACPAPSDAACPAPADAACPGPADAACPAPKA